MRQRTGYGTWHKPRASGMELVSAVACPYCGAIKGQLCRRENGTDRVLVHKARLDAYRNLG